MPSNHLILWGPLLLPPSIFPSIRVFSNESVLRIRWPNYWSFSFSISPSNEHPGLIFRMDWLDLLESLLQHYSSKPSILRRSAFFIVQLSHPHMTTGNTIALTRRRSLRNVGDLGCEPRASSRRTYLRQSGQSARPLPGENASLSASPQTCTHNGMPICPLFQQPHENSISADSLSFPFSRELHNLN